LLKIISYELKSDEETNKEEIIINENVKTVKVKKQKPLTEEQREKQRINMRNYYLARKNDPDYIERQRLSSKTHYYKHKQEVLERMKKYQLNKLELARIEALHELQQERLIDLHTGDISQEDYDKLQDKINNKLAHFHLSS
jgi:predicted Zn-dependent peptidase